MNALSPTLFSFSEKSPIRVVTKDDELWFVAADVCAVIEHSDTSMAVQRLDEDEKGTSKVCTLGGMQELFIISESGLYHLLLTSSKPQAKPFRKWVTSEVLPAIRKQGFYGAAISDRIEALSQQVARLQETVIAKPKPAPKMRPEWQWMMATVVLDISAKRFNFPYQFKTLQGEPCLLIRTAHITEYLAIRRIKVPMSARQLRKQLLAAGVVHHQRQDQTIQANRHFHLLALSLAMLERYGLKIMMPDDLFSEV